MVTLADVATAKVQPKSRPLSDWSVAESVVQILMRIGAGRGNRTPTSRSSPDFESGASSSSAIPAGVASLGPRPRAVKDPHRINIPVTEADASIRSHRCQGVTGHWKRCDRPISRPRLDTLSSPAVVWKENGAVAQLGEHEAGSLGVRGSIPLSSTIGRRGATEVAVAPSLCRVASRTVLLGLSASPLPRIQGIPGFAVDRSRDYVGSWMPHGGPSRLRAWRVASLVRRGPSS